jgi:hypothetical protein
MINGKTWGKKAITCGGKVITWYASWGARQLLVGSRRVDISSVVMLLVALRLMEYNFIPLLAPIFAILLVRLGVMGYRASNLWLEDRVFDSATDLVSKKSVQLLEPLKGEDESGLVRKDSRPILLTAACLLYACWFLIVGIKLVQDADAKNVSFLGSLAYPDLLIFCLGSLCGIVGIWRMRLWGIVALTMLACYYFPNYITYSDVPVWAVDKPYIILSRWTLQAATINAASFNLIGLCLLLIAAYYADTMQWTTKLEGEIARLALVVIGIGIIPLLAWIEMILYEEL